jgi:hypothetical protein
LFAEVGTVAALREDMLFVAMVWGTSYLGDGEDEKLGWGRIAGIYRYIQAEFGVPHDVGGWHGASECHIVMVISEIPRGCGGRLQ